MSLRSPLGRSRPTIARLTGRWCDGLPALFAGAWRCPESGEALSLTLGGTDGFGVLSVPGSRTGRCWPVVDGIPFLRSDRLETCEAVVDAIAAGRVAEARRLLFLEPREPGQLEHQLWIP